MGGGDQHSLPRSDAMSRRRFGAPGLWLVVLAGLLSGCSNLKPYESQSPANLHITTKKLKSGNLDIVSSFSAHIHVGSVGSDCSRTYTGSVELDSDKPIDIGVPAGQPSYIVVEFSNSSHFASYAATSATYKTLFTARPGLQYDMEVAYDSGAYDVNIYEHGAKKGPRREVDHRSFSSCGKT